MNPELFGTLRHHHLLATLDDSQFARIGQASQLQQFEAGQMLFQRGAPARSFYIVVDGQVRLCLQSRSGDEKVIAQLHPGQAFAEALLFSENPAYPVTAIATLRSRVAAVPSQDFKAILQASTATCFRLLADLSLRLHMHLREIEALTFENARNRLVRHLLDLAARSPGCQVVTLEETKQDLAARLAIKPETLSRTLRALADEGSIAVDGRRIRLVDPQRMQAPPG